MPNLMNKPIHVVAAVIRNGYGQILLAQRSPNCPHLPGYWEFPGGKVEEGETPKQALVRELQEEIGITATKVTPLIQVPYSYPEKQVFLDVWEVDQYMGEIKSLEGQDLVFVELEEFEKYQLPPADIPVVSALRLPQTYLITPELADLTVEQFKLSLEKTLQSGITMVQLRSKVLSKDELVPYALQAKGICGKYNAKVLINEYVEIYQQCGLDGVHFTSSQIAAGIEPIKRERKGDLMAASCHSSDDLLLIEESDVDFVLLSPVKHTKTHPGAVPVGWDVFSNLVKQVSVPVYALGGLGHSDLYMAVGHGAQGVAAIRGLWIDDCSKGKE